MFNNASSPSLADIAAVTGNNDGIGNGNGWWILIILFAIFGGWGNNRGAGYGNNCGGYPTDYARQSDVQNGFNQQTLISKIDGQTYGLADLGYAVNSQFSAAELSRANQHAALMAQMNNNALTAMQDSYAVQTQLSNCCCENRQAIAGVNYNLATNTNAITTAINQAAQNIMQNDNANYRQLHDENVAAQIAAKDAQIAEMNNRINWLTLTASQTEQNQYLVNQIKPCAVPAYVVPNPNAAYAYSTGCGCNC